MGEQNKQSKEPATTHTHTVTTQIRSTTDIVDKGLQGICFVLGVLVEGKQNSRLCASNVHLSQAVTNLEERSGGRWGRGRERETRQGRGA